MRWFLPTIMTSRLAAGNGYSGFKTITFNHLKVPNTDQTDFPVGIIGPFSYLKTVGNGGSVQNANGYDIIFTSDAAGTVKLKWTQVYWNGTTGDALYFIKIPTLSSTVDTVIYMWYGNSSVSTFQGDSVNTWDSNFAGVYNFGDGTTLDVTDAKGLVNLTNNGVTATSGIFGGAANFNGSSQYLNAGNNFGFTGDFSVCLWSYATNVVSIMAKVPAGTGKANPIKLGYYGGTNKMGMYLGDGTTDTISSSNTLQAASTWAHLGFRMSGTTYTFFLNGAADGTGTNAQSRSNNAGINTTFGTNSAVGTEWYAGKMGILWLSSSARSNDWYTTVYNNQFSPSTFYTIT